MSSSDFTQRRRQERQVQAAARAEEECAETADEKLVRASGRDEHTWKRTWGKKQGQDHQTRPEDH